MGFLFVQISLTLVSGGPVWARLGHNSVTNPSQDFAGDYSDQVVCPRLKMRSPATLAGVPGGVQITMVITASSGEPRHGHRSHVEAGISSSRSVEERDRIPDKVAYSVHSQLWRPRRRLIGRPS